jgi:hypothetical protein
METSVMQKCTWIIAVAGMLLSSGNAKADVGFPFSTPEPQAASPRAKPTAQLKKPVPTKTTLPPQGAPMKVVIVRSSEPGCEPACPEWIAAQGMIDQTTPAHFRKVLQSIGSRKLPILIDSNGGSVYDSLDIARLIRNKGLDVAVARTTISPCLETDKACKSAKSGPARVAGKPSADRARCASSCAFIMAGGIQRYASYRTPVGVHDIRSFQTTAQILQKFRIEKRLVWGVPVETKRTLISQERVNQRTTETKTPQSAYAKIASFFAEMGIGEGIMPMIKTTPHSSIHWLTRTELSATRLATGSIDGEELILSAIKSPATLSPPATTSNEASKAVQPPSASGLASPAVLPTARSQASPPAAAKP